MKSSNVGRMVSNLFKKQSPPEPRIPSSVSWETFTLALAEATGKPHYAFSKIPIDADPVDHVVGVARDHVNTLRPKGDMLKYHLRDQRVKPYYVRRGKRDGQWILTAVVRGKVMAIIVTGTPKLEHYIKAFSTRSARGSSNSRDGAPLSSFPILLMDIYEESGKFYGAIKSF